MATKGDIEDEASATTPVEEKPSKESLSQMVDSESKDDTDLDLLLDSKCRFYSHMNVKSNAILKGRWES